MEILQHTILFFMKTSLILTSYNVNRCVYHRATVVQLRFAIGQNVKILGHIKHVHTYLKVVL